MSGTLCCAVSVSKETIIKDDTPRDRENDCGARSPQNPHTTYATQDLTSTTRRFSRLRIPAGQKQKWKAPAIGLEPITCRLTEGLSWRGASGAIISVSPCWLHKGFTELTWPC